jgi:hypothetical protein
METDTRIVLCIILKFPRVQIVNLLTNWLSRKELGLLDTSICNEVDHLFLLDLYNQTCFKLDTKSIGLRFLGWLALKRISLQKIELTNFNELEVFYPNLHLDVFERTITLVVQNCSIDNLTEDRLGKMLNTCVVLTSLSMIATEAFTDEVIVLLMNRSVWGKLISFNHEGNSLVEAHSMAYIASICCSLQHLNLEFEEPLCPVMQNDWVVSLIANNKHLKHICLSKSVIVGPDALKSLLKNPFNTETIIFNVYDSAGGLDEADTIVELLSEAQLTVVELNSSFKFRKNNNNNNKSISFENDCVLSSVIIPRILNQIGEFMDINVALCTAEILSAIQQSQNSLEILDVGTLPSDLYHHATVALASVFMSSRLTHFSIGIPSGVELNTIIQHSNSIKVLTAYNMTSLSGIKQLLECHRSVIRIELIKKEGIEWDVELRNELVVYSEFRGGNITISLE